MGYKFNALYNIVHRKIKWSYVKFKINVIKIKTMEIKLTNKEAEEMFYNALCNGLGYVTSGYGLELKYSNKEYRQAKESIEKNGVAVCYEDVFMAMLRSGYKLSLHDEEGEETYEIELKDVHERMEKVPVRNILNMIEENDDAEDADVVIQTVFLKEVIFG